MQTATMTTTDAMADRILAFGATLQGRQREILRHMVSAGRSRLDGATESDMTAKDAEDLLEENARSGQQNDAAWTFDVWTHQY